MRSSSMAIALASRRPDLGGVYLLLVQVLLWCHEERTGIGGHILRPHARTTIPSRDESSIPTIEMMRTMPTFLRLVLVLGSCCSGVTAFAGIHAPPAFAMSRQQQQQQQQVAPYYKPTLTRNNNNYKKCSLVVLCAAQSSDMSPRLEPIPSEEEGIPIPFVDVTGSSFIECYADSVAILNGIQYTIGVPCDHSVALCYYDEFDQLIPIELEDDLMDDIFPVAEQIVTEEFGEELTLERTPQTLTLVGELDDADENDEDDDEDDDDEDDEDMEDGEEEVEVLFSFEHRDREYHLVRLLDPILLVAKADDEQPDRRVLLTPEESATVMPVLEEMFLEFHKEDSMLP